MTLFFGKIAGARQIISRIENRENNRFYFYELQLKEDVIVDGLRSSQLLIKLEMDDLDEEKPESKVPIYCECFRPVAKNRGVDSIYEKLLLDESIKDVELVLGEKRFPAHKVILAANSPVFHRMFSHQMKESLSKEVEIKEVDPEVFEQLLKYMYTKKVGKFKEFAGELLIVANRYEMEDFKLICERVLMKNVNLENVVEFLMVADTHNAINLKKHCFCIIMANFAEVVNKDEFKELKNSHANVLLELNLEMATKCDIKMKYIFKK